MKNSDSETVEVIELYDPVSCEVNTECPDVPKRTIEAAHFLLTYRWSYPNVENLVDMLSPFARQKCLVVINNQFKIDLINEELNPIMIKAFYPTVSAERVVWAPGNLTPINVTKIDGRFICPTSKLFNDSQPSIICSQLNFTKFSIRSKQWYCYVQLTLFSPRASDFITKERKLPHTVFPSLGPPFVQLFVHLKDDFKQEESDFIEWAMYALPSHWKNKNDRCQHVLLLILVQKNLNKTTQLSATTGTVEEINFIRLCQYNAECCKSVVLLYNSTNALLPPAFLNLSTLIRISRPSPTTNVFWNFRHTYTNMTVVDSQYRHISNCTQTLTPSTRSEIYFTKSDRVGQGYANVWISIMGNYTILYYEDEPFSADICVRGVRENISDTYRFDSVKLGIKPYIKRLVIFPYSDHNYISPFYYVSCGKRGVDSIPFRELVNVFEKWIWILIIVSGTCVTTIPYWSHVHSGFGIGTHLFLSLKSFLEQGDAFPGGLGKDKRFQISIGLFLLMGIVISNAYKNTNVYNMIAPRRNIPYTYLHELLTDNFVIYTRSASIILKDDQGDQMGFFDLLTVSISGYESMSEVNKSLNAIVEILKDDQLISKIEAMNVITSSALYVSKLLDPRIQLNPQIANMVDSIMLDFKNLARNGNKSGMIQKYAEVEGNFLRWQDEIMEEELTKCGKVAVVFPEEKGILVWKNLKRKLNRTDIYADMVAESDIQIQFILNRSPILPHIPPRIKSAHEMGLWKR